MGHSHVRNLVRVIAIVVSVNDMQFRLYGALSEGEMPWKILMLIYHCQRIKEDSGKSLCLYSLGYEKQCNTVSLPCDATCIFDFVLFSTTARLDFAI